MKLHLISTGHRRPSWERDGFENFARRMPPECALQLIEVAPVRRTRSTVRERALEEEGKRALAAVPKGARIVALDVAGKEWSTRELSRRLDGWLGDGRDVALLVGGADGLSPACLARAETRWSLSRLTFPHGLVRVVAAEQLYRAWSILRNHPYHRE